MVVVKYHMKIAITICFIVLVIFGAFTFTRHTPIQRTMEKSAKSNSRVVRTATPDTPLDSLLHQRGLSKGDVRLHIDKSAFILQVMHDTLVIKSYPVVLGGNPIEDKRREGDLCTPEGNFTLRNLYPHGKWSKFLWIDYPTAESWSKHNASKAAGEIPQDAGIGGEIGIHGVPEGRDHWIDEMEHWTLGCISLKNAHIDEIYSVCQKGTVVEIVK